VYKCGIYVCAPKIWEVNKFRMEFSGACHHTRFFKRGTRLTEKLIWAPMAAVTLEKNSPRLHKASVSSVRRGLRQIQWLIWSAPNPCNILRSVQCPSQSWVGRRPHEFINRARQPSGRDSRRMKRERTLQCRFFARTRPRQNENKLTRLGERPAVKSAMQKAHASKLLLQRWSCLCVYARALCFSIQRAARTPCVCLSVSAHF
jgi:hypothetical protein